MLMQCFINVNLILRTKIGSSDFEISVVCASKEYDVATPYYSFFALYYLSVVTYGEVNNKRKFQTLSSKSGCSHL